MNGPVYVAIAIAILFSIVKYQESIRSFISGTTTSGSPTDVKGFFAKYATPLLTLAGIVLLWWLYTTDVSLVDVAKWSRQHWLWIIVVGIIVYTAIVIKAVVLKGSASVLRTVVGVGVLAMLLLATPMGDWFVNFTSGGASRTMRTSSAKELPKLVIPAGGYSDHVMPPIGYSTKFYGHGYVIRCVYADGKEGIVGDKEHPCGDGHILYSYVKNTTEEMNVVSYEFIRHF